MSKKLEIEKSFLYHRVLESVKEAECPVCFYVNRATWNYIDSLLYERVMDPGTRKGLKLAKGYCPNHAWQVARAGDAFGISMLYRDLVGLFQRETRVLVGNNGFKGPSFREKVKKWVQGKRQKRLVSKKRICPLCDYQKDTEKLTLSSIADYLRDEEFCKGYMESRGLCYPHFLEGLKMSHNPEITKVLIRKEMQALEELDWGLNEFIRKQDYRYRNEPIGSEGSAWIKSIEHLTGKDWIGFQRIPNLYDPVDQLRLKNQQLERENKRLRENNERLMEIESKAAALHYQTHKQAKDIQTLEFQVNGARSQRDDLLKFVEMQKKEIQELKEKLKQGSLLQV